MKTIADINAIREKMQAEISVREQGGADVTRVVIGMATCGIAAGAREVYNAIMDELSAKNIRNVKVARSGCLGVCKLEPIVEVYVKGQEKVTYTNVDAKAAKTIVDNHVIGGKVCAELLK